MSVYAVLFVVAWLSAPFIASANARREGVATTAPIAFAILLGPFYFFIQRAVWRLNDRDDG